jgi:hypothetical protein
MVNERKRIRGFYARRRRINSSRRRNLTPLEISGCALISFIAADYFLSWRMARQDDRRDSRDFAAVTTNLETNAEALQQPQVRR